MRTRYLGRSLGLCSVGAAGLRVNTRSILLALMCIELMLLGVNRGFMAAAVSLDDLMGEVLALLVLTVAAGESAIGRAVLVVYYRVHGTIALRTMNILHG